MKILFDLRKTGLGNNGGSLTLVNSANTLCEIGHTAIVIDSMKNQYTWGPLNAALKIIKNNEDIPDADAIISTGYKSVGSTVSAPERCGLKMHWIRGWETWKIVEEDIASKILSQPTIKLVNGIELQNKLKSFGFDSYIIRPGYDLKDFYPTEMRDKTKYIIIGGLYHQGDKAFRKRTEWIFTIARVMKERYNNVKLWMFGPDNPPTDPLIDRYFKSPSMKEKNEIYNSVSIWLAPTMLEGLHMPPAEAMLTECFVIGTNTEMSGMKDYLINEETGCVSKNFVCDMLEKVEHYYCHAELRKEIGVKARNKILDIGDRQKNMNELVQLIERLK
jgi:glycosyltransferase involved in cell wall biosynthesis